MSKKPIPKPMPQEMPGASPKHQEDVRKSRCAAVGLGVGAFCFHSNAAEKTNRINIKFGVDEVQASTAFPCTYIELWLQYGRKRGIGGGTEIRKSKQ